MKKKVILFAAILFAIVRPVSAQEKPNVVIFLIDDLREELGCYGNEMVKSPNIDKLANEGILFNKAYAQQGICAPSRMSLLTGLRPETIGVYDIFTPLRKVRKDIESMPQFFKSKGYKTVSVGKVFHHSTDDKAVWDLYYPKEDNSYACQENLDLIENLKKKGEKNTNGPAFESADVADEAYKDGRAANNAIDALNKLKNDKFLLIVGFSKPHLPFNAPKKYWDLYSKNDFKVPSREVPENVYLPGMPKWRELAGYSNIPKEGLLNDDLTKDLRHGYYACVSYMDAQVGKVMQTLDKLDLRKNTIIVFMSDHGYKIGEYGAWCKQSNLEIDVKVPLIIARETALKGSVKNVKSNSIVENLDVFPTIIEAIGENKVGLEGKSLLPLTVNKKIKESPAAYNLYPHGKKGMGVSCTDGIWRYTEWKNNEGKLLGKELFLHSDDTRIAKANVAGKADYKKVEEKMKKLLEIKFPESRKSYYDVNLKATDDGTPVNSEE
ncbi:sulfatase [Flavobacterium faecale]|uniref:sulfatase n=1 Tax=Flavobacterium faecale TaxID=1355330 RepID=UPI003AAB5E1B